MNTLYNTNFSVIIGRRDGELKSWRHSGHVSSDGADKIARRYGFELVKWYHRRYGGNGYVYEVAEFQVAKQPE